MSDIFYSQVDANLQIELNARARAGKTKRTERELQYMLEKIANCEVIAYAGNKRDATQEIHRLGGKTVLSGEYLPSGETGYLTNRAYTLKTAKWVAKGEVITPAGPGGGQTYDANIIVNESLTSEDYANSSYRIPPYITSADISISDNSIGLLNKATINITIPNPDRDLDFMESVYGRPGRYLSVTFAHPDSAIVSYEETEGLLTTDSLPKESIIKSLYPNTVYNDLRKMNQLMFEGLLTSFEYNYNTDGTVTMTVYITGTSNTYTDLTLIMSGSATGSAGEQIPVQDQATTFYESIYKEIDSYYQINEAKRKGLTPPAPTPAYNEQINQILDARYASMNERWWLIGSCLSGKNNRYITLNWLIDFINGNVLSKMKNVTDFPIIQCSTVFDHYSNYLPYLVSTDPDNILFFVAETNNIYNEQTDTYGVDSNGNPKKWVTNFRSKYTPIDASSGWENAYSEKSFAQGLPNVSIYKEKTLYRPSMIRINLELIKSILNEISTADSFRVHVFLAKLSEKIFAASGGWINMKLVTDPVDLTVLYYLDANFVPKENVQPYEVPMFANHPLGTIVREFSFKSKLPQSVQNLMYAINQSDRVSEASIAPYLHFMYNNATITRNGNVETSSTGPSKEQLEKVAKEYKDLHVKYIRELIAARQEFGNNPNDANKRTGLKTALEKYIQYPFPTIQESGAALAPLFPMEVDFTIDGINGLRYGDVLDFPGLPARYRNHMTFSIKSLSHTLSTGGDWTLKIGTVIRPLFD